jgi:hypothetical protein
MCRIKYSICETIGSVELFAVSQEKTRHAQLINPRILVYSKRTGEQNGGQFWKNCWNLEEKFGFQIHASLLQYYYIEIA